MKRLLLTGTIIARPLTPEERARRDAGQHPLGDDVPPRPRLTWARIVWALIGAALAGIAVGYLK